MMMSGLVLNDDVKWVSFHSSYDFGYLLKTLTCKELPMEESAFLELLHTYFPYIYDVKYMMTAVEGMYGGLSALADTLQVERIGPMHQAGSDSLLTAQTFFSLINKHFQGTCDDSKFRGELFGLGSNHTKYKGKGYNEGGGGGGGGNGSGTGNGNGSRGQPMAYSGQVRPGCHCTFDALCRPPFSYPSPVSPASTPQRQHTRAGALPGVVDRAADADAAARPHLPRRRRR